MIKQSIASSHHSTTFTFLFLMVPPLILFGKQKTLKCLPMVHDQTEKTMKQTEKCDSCNQNTIEKQSIAFHCNLSKEKFHHCSNFKVCLVLLEIGHGRRMVGQKERCTGTMCCGMNQLVFRTFVFQSRIPGVFVLRSSDKIHLPHSFVEEGKASPSLLNVTCGIPSIHYIDTAASAVI